MIYLIILVSFYVFFIFIYGCYLFTLLAEALCLNLGGILNVSMLKQYGAYPSTGVPQLYHFCI